MISAGLVYAPLILDHMMVCLSVTTVRGRMFPFMIEIWETLPVQVDKKFYCKLFSIN